MEAFDPAGAADGRRVLLLAPHCDDEALGAGGSVCRLTSGGALVLPVILASSPGVVGEVPEEQRRAESERACELLGTRPPRFLGVSSRELRDDPAGAAARLGPLVADAGPFDAVFVPAPFERHPTHRASLMAALLAAAGADWLRPGADWWGYGAWDALPAAPGVFEIDVSAARKAKTQAVAAHASQNAARPLGAAIASRDMAHAVFSRLTGEEPRKAVERLMDLRELAGAVGAALRALGDGDGAGAGAGAARARATRATLVEWLRAWSAGYVEHLWASD